ncbi:MAG: site-specific integrase [Phycisphaerae bacterium]|nr:site-specific integrase [Phycisphaerae bacterium]
MDHAREYYTRPDGQTTVEFSHLKTASRIVRHLYARTPAAEFGPLALKACRERMVEKGWCRRHVNQQTTRVKRIFRWAVENELIGGEAYHALQAVAGLRRGRTRAKESKSVKPVPIEYVNAVKPYVSRQVWALIQLQILTAARGGELVILRPCDVDRTGETWLYTPADHKTAHHGHSRTIYIGPRARRILSPFLLRAPEDYCFNPSEADAERRAILSAARTTPMSCGNRPGTNRHTKPQRQPGDHYTPHSYARAIRCALKQAFPPPAALARRKGELVKEYEGRLTAADRQALREWHKKHHWHPHQLRHNAATELRKEFGLETARIILGHRSPAVTTLYAEEDRQKAVDAIMKVG